MGKAASEEDALVEVFGRSPSYLDCSWRLLLARTDSGAGFGATHSRQLVCERPHFETADCKERDPLIWKFVNFASTA
eukprot:3573145-Pleurochrysis_carterae.AAC.3